MSIKVSVIVPVYNVEKYVEKCILSILSQTYENFELILLNDGSTDRSYDILLKYIDTPKVTVVNKNNTGQADTRYQGLLMANGDYVYFVDSDDFIEPYTLERLVSKLDNASVDVVFGRYRLVNEQGSVLREQKKYSIDALNGTETILRDAISVSNFKSSLCLKIIRRSLLISSYVDEIRNIHINEDVCLSIFLASHCNKVVFIDDVVYNVLQRDNSVSRNIKQDIITVNDVIYGLIEQRLHNLGMWDNLESVYYNGYVKTILYALALVAVKIPSYAEFNKYYSLLDDEGIYYSIGLKRNLKHIQPAFKYTYILSKYPRIFYYVIRMFKSYLKY